MTNKDNLNVVWNITEIMREEGVIPNFNNFVKTTIANGLEVNYDMLRIFDQRINRSGSYITGKESKYLISKFISQLEPKRILDPACGSGSLFSNISFTNDLEIIGIDINSDILNVAETTFKDNINFSFINADFFNLEQDIGKFDIIMGDIPQGRINNYTHNNIRTSNIGDAFLLSSLDLLNENGYLIFILYDSFFYRAPNVRRYLRNNYSVEAVISLPKGIFNKGFKRSLIIIKKTIQSKRLYLAKLDGLQSADVIVDNFFNKKSNNNALQGYWINSERINDDNVWTLDYFQGLNTLKNKKSKINQYFKHLSEIAEVKQQLDESDDILLIPRFATKEVILLPELELSKGDSHNKERELKRYFKCRINDKTKLLPQYLKIFLNSEIGKYQRRLFSSGSTIEQINGRGVRSLNIAIPDIETQKSIIDADQKITEWYNETVSLRERFKNNVFNFEDVLGIISGFQENDKIGKKISIDTSSQDNEMPIMPRNPVYDDLLWPLASSYISATKGSSEPIEKALNYFNLFELVAAFNSIVLLSSLPDNIYLDKKDEIWENYKGYRTVSFGNWVGLYRRLSIIFQHEQFDLPFDNEFYKEIYSPKIINILDPIPAKRNSNVHGGVISRINAVKSVDELNPYLKDIFEILMSYNTLLLIYTESMTKEQEIYEIRVIRLNGACYPFIHDIIKTEKDMDTNSLYLYNPYTDERLKLKNNFIKLVQCEECSLWSLYIYNKIKNNKAIYRSYQSEQHDLKIQDISLEDIFELD